MNRNNTWINFFMLSYLLGLFLFCVIEIEFPGNRTKDVPVGDIKDQGHGTHGEVCDHQSGVGFTKDQVRLCFISLGADLENTAVLYGLLGNYDFSGRLTDERIIDEYL